jgi:uncharacterized membrane protein
MTDWKGRSPGEHPESIGPSGALGRDGEHRACSWVIKRNCSIAPRALVWFLAGTAVFSFAIGLGFAWYGLWLVLPFVGLEIGALVVAFVVHARHATDRESISLDQEGLVVEIQEASRQQRYVFSAYWAQLTVSDEGQDVRLLVGSHGRRVEIGRHLDQRGRRVLAQELNRRLAQMRIGAR